MLICLYVYVLLITALCVKVELIQRGGSQVKIIWPFKKKFTSIYSRLIADEIVDKSIHLKFLILLTEREYIIV